MRAASQPELYDLPNSDDPVVARYNEAQDGILGYRDHAMQVFIVTLVTSTTGIGTVQLGIGIAEPQPDDLLTRIKHLCQRASLALIVGEMNLHLSGQPSDPSHATYEDYVRSGALIGTQTRKGTRGILQGFLLSVPVILSKRT